VIRFRDTLSRSTPPPWLAGAENLHRRQSRCGELWACGDALYLTDAGPWRDIGDGYEVSGPVESWEDYRKREDWAEFDIVTDLRGREWAAPRVIDAAGDRVFRVAYGPDFLPELTAEQYRMLDVAKAARDALTAGAAGTQDVPMTIACRWAADLLGVAYRLPVPAVAALAIMDDGLAAAVLATAVGAGVEVA
jgi:hypothetical protein